MKLEALRPNEIEHFIAKHNWLPNSIQADAVRKFASMLLVARWPAEPSPESEISTRYEILREALELIAGDRADCESSTSGAMSCKKNGRRRIARFGADKWCDRCIANDALNRAEELAKK
jgi:hypothetical protein